MKQQVDISYEQMRFLVIHVLSLPTSDPPQLSDLRRRVAAAIVKQHGVTPHPEGQFGIIQQLRA